MDRSTVSRPTRALVPLTRSCSHAPLLETTSAFSMPGEVTPAAAGHAARPVPARESVSKVHTAIGTRGSARVFQSTRQYVARAVAPTAATKRSAPLRRAGPSG
ncbi:hypothetical protein [Nocardioides marmoribigeumensis]|uniref:Uncharacterized protein n=1 Tax=Nocardioides marmoribigeumensis TaxID=433649 RepID=A0ABU2BQ85_9ACTN|nr:hypothetical protein [Nocardioides marmoribigeumensis]MDR7360800.1 hypothetical protein [Nocardioides marmoribigeumensis]